MASFNNSIEISMGKCPKFVFRQYNLLGRRYNHLVNTAELHFIFLFYISLLYFIQIRSDGQMTINVQNGHMPDIHNNQPKEEWCNKYSIQNTRR